MARFFQWTFALMAVFSMLLLLTNGVASRALVREGAQAVGEVVGTAAGGVAAAAGGVASGIKHVAQLPGAAVEGLKTGYHQGVQGTAKQ